MTAIVAAKAGLALCMAGETFDMPVMTGVEGSIADYLEKPFDPRNLRAIVQRYLR